MVNTNWEQGEPCPECGSTEISIEAVHEEIYISEDGDFEFKQRGVPLDSIGKPMCVECEEKLAQW